MQHLSALFRDVELARMCNVLPNIDNEELPNDVYQEVSKTVVDQIDKIKDVNLKNVLSKINIDRKLLKKPVMTVPYNVGLSSAPAPSNE
jgi:DNA-directed RNA polymerase